MILRAVFNDDAFVTLDGDDVFVNHVLLNIASAVEYKGEHWSVTNIGFVVCVLEAVIAKQFQVQSVCGAKQWASGREKVADVAKILCSENLGKKSAFWRFAVYSSWDSRDRKVSWASLRDFRLHGAKHGVVGYNGFDLRICTLLESSFSWRAIAF